VACFGFVALVFLILGALDFARDGMPVTGAWELAVAVASTAVTWWWRPRH
jgi:hypothetical protein